MPNHVNSREGNVVSVSQVQHEKRDVECNVGHALTGADVRQVGVPGPIHLDDGGASFPQVLVLSTGVPVVAAKHLQPAVAEDLHFVVGVDVKSLQLPRFHFPVQDGAGGEQEPDVAGKDGLCSHCGCKEERVFTRICSFNFEI